MNGLYLNSSFRQVGFSGQTFTGGNTGVVRLLELLLPLLKLFRAEGGPIPAEFLLIGR